MEWFVHYEAFMPMAAWGSKWGYHGMRLPSYAQKPPDISSFRADNKLSSLSEACSVVNSPFVFSGVCPDV